MPFSIIRTDLASLGEISVLAGGVFTVLVETESDVTLSDFVFATFTRFRFSGMRFAVPQL